MECLKHITAHPVFKSNPHTAIREHLRSQLAASAAAARAVAKEKGEGGEGEEGRRHGSLSLKKREEGGDGGRRLSRYVNSVECHMLEYGTRVLVGVKGVGMPLVN